MKQRFRQAVSLLGRNKRTLVIFELFSKLTATALLLSMLWMLGAGTMYVEGYDYLTRENILKYMRHPATILAAVLFLLTLGLVSAAEAGGLICVVDRCWHGRKITVTETMYMAGEGVKRIVRSRSAGAILTMLGMLPFIHIGAIVALSQTIAIPGFFQDFLKTHRLVLAGGVLALVLSGVLLFRRVFAFHYYLLDGDSFREARKRSKALQAGHQAGGTGLYLLMQFCLYLLYVAVAAMGILLIILLSWLLGKVNLINAVQTTAVWIFLVFLIWLFGALSFPVMFVGVSVRYYRWKQQQGEGIRVPGRYDPPMHQKIRRMVPWRAALLAGVVLAGAAAAFYSRVSGRVRLNIEYITSTEVTAHRGASALYPENTMAAFEGALELGADWIELDVQQSRDGVLFISHDANLKRTTGVNKNAWQMDWEEISQLDAGSYFGKEFAGERIPLLSEVIEWAKEHFIRLNIELKPSGHEVDLEKQVVDMIYEHDFVYECVVTSQVYSSLEKVKACSDEIETVYVMALAYGNVGRLVTRLTAADCFSVEAASISENLVSRVHNAGKELYAWTVNTRGRINRMISRNVDNIITDEVALAIECVYGSKTSSLIGQYISWIRSLR